jgi:hypothetical protein
MLVHRSNARAYRGAWIAALLLLSFAVPSTYAQEPTTPSMVPAASPPPPGIDVALPQITITGKSLQRAVDKFVYKAMGSGYVRAEEHPVTRWRQPICPLVAGLSRTKGQLLFDRLVAAWTSLAIPVGASGCQANFFVIVSAHPEADLKAMWRHADGMFGDARRARSFIDTPRPVRIWYNTRPIASDGTIGGVIPTFGPPLPFLEFRGPPLPDLEFSMLPDLTSVFAVVDVNRVAGLEWPQVADYIAMTGLTELKLDADVGDVPSILRLFTTSGEARPQRLSDWDKTFIKELYVTNAVLRGQRAEIAKRMYRDLAAP